MNLRGPRKCFAAAAAAIVLAGGFASRSEAAIAYALTDENDLLQIDTGAPEDILSGGVITGLAGQDLIGIDFRPGNGQLYGVGNLGGVFQINTTTRAATQVSSLVPDGTDTTNPFGGLAGSRFGFDFNPVSDRLRIVSDTEQSLRVNVDTGLTITDGDLQYGPGQPGATGDNPAVTSAAYTNSFPPSPRATPGTTLYTIDVRENEDRLLIQNPPNNGTLVYVSMLGVNASALSGFDIFFDPSRPVGQENVGFAVLQDINGGISRLYQIDLTIGLATNSATEVGTIGAGDLIDGLAVTPIPEPAGLALTGLAGAALLRRRR
jgi:MYXO-CTERM domain-containing protein